MDDVADNDTIDNDNDFGVERLRSLIKDEERVMALAAPKLKDDSYMHRTSIDKKERLRLASQRSCEHANRCQKDYDEAKRVLEQRLVGMNIEKIERKQKLKKLEDRVEEHARAWTRRGHEFIKDLSKMIRHDVNEDTCQDMRGKLEELRRAYESRQKESNKESEEVKELREAATASDASDEAAKSSLVKDVEEKKKELDSAVKNNERAIESLSAQESVCERLHKELDNVERAMSCSVKKKSVLEGRLLLAEAAEEARAEAARAEADAEAAGTEAAGAEATGAEAAAELPATQEGANADMPSSDDEQFPALRPDEVHSVPGLGLSLLTDSDATGDDGEEDDGEEDDDEDGDDGEEEEEAGRKVDKDAADRHGVGEDETSSDVSNVLYNGDGLREEYDVDIVTLGVVPDYDLLRGGTSGTDTAARASSTSMSGRSSSSRSTIKKRRSDRTFKYNGNMELPKDLRSRIPDGLQWDMGSAYLRQQPRKGPKVWRAAVLHVQIYAEIATMLARVKSSMSETQGTNFDEEDRKLIQHLEQSGVEPTNALDLYLSEDYHDLKALEKKVA